jgi:hypothetical protein
MRNRHRHKTAATKHTASAQTGHWLHRAFDKQTGGAVPQPKQDRTPPAPRSPIGEKPLQKQQPSPPKKTPGKKQEHGIRKKKPEAFLTESPAPPACRVVSAMPAPPEKAEERHPLVQDAPGAESELPMQDDASKPRAAPPKNTASGPMVTQPQHLPSVPLVTQTPAAGFVPDVAHVQIAPSIPPARESHSVVKHPHIVFQEKDDVSYIVVPALHAIWDVDWELSVHLEWGQTWEDVRYETDVEIEKLNHDPLGHLLWIKGLIRLSAIGIPHGTAALHHERLSLPFTCTILSPPDKRGNSDRGASPANVLPLPQQGIWAETGDWKADTIAFPSDHRVFDGFIRISGRVWWFRKALIPWQRAACFHPC